MTGPIWHVSFDWIVTVGPQSFTAWLSGILNTTTGAVVMNGTVVDGWLEGAQVQRPVNSSTRPHSVSRVDPPDAGDHVSVVAGGRSRK